MQHDPNLNLTLMVMANYCGPSLPIILQIKLFLNFSRKSSFLRRERANQQSANSLVLRLSSPARLFVFALSLYAIFFVVLYRYCLHYLLTISNVVTRIRDGDAGRQGDTVITTVRMCPNERKYEEASSLAGRSPPTLPRFQYPHV